MDASHFTESSVLLSCFFKEPTNDSQSQINAADSTVIITQIKSTYNSKPSCLFCGYLLSWTTMVERSLGYEYCLSKKYVSTPQSYISLLFAYQISCLVHFVHHRHYFQNNQLHIIMLMIILCSPEAKATCATPGRTPPLGLGRSLLVRTSMW